MKFSMQIINYRALIIKDATKGLYKKILSLHGLIYCLY